MASATGIPEQHLSSANNGHGEQEPLLGRPGDASQKEGKSLAWNLVLGTGIIAQAGIWIVSPPNRCRRPVPTLLTLPAHCHCVGRHFVPRLDTLLCSSGNWFSLVVSFLAHALMPA